MTNEEAKKMLKAKLECLKRETSGTDIDCNYRNCDECDLCYAQGNMGEQKEVLEMAIKALDQQAKAEWIPVSERLPEGMGTYMTTVDYGKHGLATGQRYYYGQGLWEDDCVIAWMPLPQPYKAESESDVQ